jgi:uncharacterized RDD family membrane protein YckC
MNTTNPYAPPQATVADVVDPRQRHVDAERGTRLAAAFLDGLIFGAMVYVPFLAGTIAGVFTTGVADYRPGTTVTGAMIVGIVIGLIGFAVWCWLTIKFVIANGQSIAKKMLDIKVVRADGSPISLGRLFWLRNVVNSMLAIVPLYGFIDILFIFGERRQCLHDKIADTIVVKA